jgi:hypothetical protein
MILMALILSNSYLKGEFKIKIIRMLKTNKNPKIGDAAELLKNC